MISAAVRGSTGGEAMKRANREDVQESDHWDLDGGEIHEPVKRPRAVVSVSFERNDFEQVADAARAAGVRISEYIRDAALARSQAFRPFSGSLSNSGVKTHNFTSQSGSPKIHVRHRSPNVLLKT
jgi:predicted ABC-class ATPase